MDLGADLDDAFTLALALRFLGDIAINVDADLDRAQALLDRSLAAAEELGNPAAIVRTLLFAGWVPWTRGDTAEAEAIWRGRSRSPSPTTAGRACERSTPCRSTSPAPPEPARPPARTWRPPSA